MMQRSNKNIIVATCIGLGAVAVAYFFLHHHSSRRAAPPPPPLPSQSNSDGAAYRHPPQHDPFLGSGASPATAGPPSTSASFATTTTTDITVSSSSGKNAPLDDHEKVGLEQKVQHLRDVGDKVRPTLFPNGAGAVKATRCSDDAPIPPGCKKIHLIRHGQGTHNVAQKLWREAKKEGEPYYPEIDVENKYLDADLTSEGEEQAKELVERANKLDPDLIIVSPLRRATRTALIAFGRHLAEGNNKKKFTKAIATDLVHEKGNRHTCDKRFSKSKLVSLFGDKVDYSLVTEEEDPLWDETSSKREAYEHMARRGADFLALLKSRDEKEQQIVVATHSAFLAVITNSVLQIESREDAAWFATGECRSFIFEWRC